MFCIFFYRSEFEGIVPDYQALEESDKTGRILEVIFTMKGSENFKDKDGREYDFVSRNFSPWVGIPEDPVTGNMNNISFQFQRCKKSLQSTRWTR